MIGLVITEFHDLVLVSYRPCSPCTGEGATISDAVDDLLRQLDGCADLREAVEAAWDRHFETLECEEMAADDGLETDCGMHIDDLLRALSEDSP
jgi:predicted methyltransferase